MSTFVLIHGSADVGASWRLVERELRKKGHDVVAPDLPCDDNTAGLQEYADTVVRAIGRRKNLVVVGHSYAGFTAPIVADRCGASALVLVAAMVPAPGEAPKDYWKNTRHAQAVRKQAALDGGLTGHSDPLVQYYHDVPRKLAERAMRSERSESTAAYESLWPLARWPRVPTKFVLCTEDRLFPADYMRRVVSDRLGIVPDEIAAGHYVLLSRPKELAALLDSYAERRRRAARKTRSPSGGRR
jgi:pimeloyl-ACP methyl ester carboxylesterase